jgi:branched-chain amino acid transport system ATP-binding protein
MAEEASVLQSTPRPLLSVQGLSAAYGSAQVLFNVAFSVHKGEVAALLGRNGAGKSTTMKAVMGLVRVPAGQVEFMGQSIVGRPTYEISRRGLAFVPEDRRIFTSLTVTENLEVGRQDTRGASAWTPERLFELFPNLAERRKSLASRMSGGEQQMLAVARALMSNPTLMLLDEPSEGIAPIIVDQMTAAIRELKQRGIAIVVSEQNLSFAKRICDRAYILEKGSVVRAATIAELIGNPNLSSTYLAVGMRSDVKL